jgi:D-serine deaminase-like pyridoxal phosphate-dependent protein
MKATRVAALTLGELSRFGVVADSAKNVRKWHQAVASGDPPVSLLCEIDRTARERRLDRCFMAAGASAAVATGDP